MFDSNTTATGRSTFIPPPLAVGDPVCCQRNAGWTRRAAYVFAVLGGNRYLIAADGLLAEADKSDVGFEPSEAEVVERAAAVRASRQGQPTSAGRGKHHAPTGRAEVTSRLRCYSPRRDGAFVAVGGWA